MEGFVFQIDMGGTSSTFIAVKFANDMDNTGVISYFIHNVEWLSGGKNTC